ncbi:MAG: class I SAM-dependent methyltransferase [Thermodesulfobacteriota bacterium]|nr:class I SAM-dependent methyltransferase [Thermodesulfobacteriota bacterium]
MTVFHEVRNVPVNSVVNLPTRGKALDYPRGDVSLAFCHDCGFVSNVAFDGRLLKYSAECEESQSFSPTHNAYSRRLAGYLTQKYDLRHKEVLEIGCGKGDFLSLLCELGENRGVGFDPAFVPGRVSGEGSDRIVFIQDYFSEKYADHSADFLCCVMTLEHIYNTADFVNMVRRTIGNRNETILFFQVPDATRILRDTAFQDIYYEHCSYFSPGSMARLFRRCGFDVLNLATDYDNQYLTLEAKPAVPPTSAPFPEENDIENLRTCVNAFKTKYQEKVAAWQRYVEQVLAKKQRLVLWGSGSKAVAFLTTFPVTEGVEYVVDINPYRQGTFMAGTGQEIVHPNFLKDYRPDVVIAMNAIYREEIQHDLTKMNLAPELVAFH